MQRYPATVAPESDLAVAREMMVWTGSSYLPVVGEDRRLVGLLGERDVLAFQVEHPDRLWKESLVADAMRASPETAGPDDSLTEVAARLAAHRIDCLPVTDKGRLVGMVTTTDVLTAEVQTAMAPSASSGSPTVADAMTPEPITVHPDDHILDAADRMRQRGVRHLPVVDGTGALVGMLSDRDVRAAIGDPAQAANGPGRARVEELRVEDAMTRGGVTVTEREACRDVAAYFAALHASAVAVLDDEGRLTGILSYVDLLRALAGPTASRAA